MHLVVALPPRGLAPTLSRPRAGPHVARDVERVALAIAEAVDHGAAAAALLTDGLAEGLRLAPVSAQVATLSHYQGLLAGRQDLWLRVQESLVPLRGRVSLGLVRRRDRPLGS